MMVFLFSKSTYKYVQVFSNDITIKLNFDTDAMTVIGFLKHFGLANDFKLNIEPNHTTLAGHQYHHDVMMASM